MNNNQNVFVQIAREIRGVRESLVWIHLTLALIFCALVVLVTKLP